MLKFCAIFALLLRKSGVKYFIVKLKIYVKMEIIEKMGGVQFHNGLVNETVSVLMRCNVCTPLAKAVVKFLNGGKWEWDKEVDGWVKTFKIVYSNALLAHLADGWMVGYVVRYFEENGIAEQLHERGYFCSIDKDEFDGSFEVLIKRLG